MARDTGFTIGQIIDANKSNVVTWDIPPGYPILIPQNERMQTMQNAAGKADDQRYGKQGTVDNFGPGTWKCNKLVCDAITEAGGVAPRHWRGTFFGFDLGESKNSPAMANEWAMNGPSTGRWTVVNQQDALPGDIIAFPYPGGLGHSGVFAGRIAITVNGRTVRGDVVISAGPQRVQVDSLSHFSSYNKPVFRGLAVGRNSPP